MEENKMESNRKPNMGRNKSGIIFDAYPLILNMSGKFKYPKYGLHEPYPALPEFADSFEDSEYPLGRETLQRSRARRTN